jgi:hypothetical protein
MPVWLSATMQQERIETFCKMQIDGNSIRSDQICQDRQLLSWQIDGVIATVIQRNLWNEEAIE